VDNLNDLASIIVPELIVDPEMTGCANAIESPEGRFGAVPGRFRRI